MTQMRVRAAMRILLALFYAAAGVLHFRAVDQMLLITPDWVPAPRLVILATGVCEIMGAIALLTPRLRRAAAWALALYAVCVFPANIKHALEGIDVAGLPSGWMYHGPRLLAQPVIVWWTLYCAEILDWPFRRRARSK